MPPGHAGGHSASRGRGAPASLKALSQEELQQVTFFCGKLNQAKSLWSMDNNKPPDAVPSWDDLTPYLKNWDLPTDAHHLPRPQDGHYIIGSVNEDVKYTVKAQ